MKTKLWITIIFVLSQFAVMAGTKGFTPLNQEIILRTSEGTIRTWVLGVNKKISPKPDRFYYGYYMDGLFCKQGELQGKPLNGEFHRYDMKENIIESGHFKYGLKTGLWKQLSPGGILTETSEYQKGMLCGEHLIYKNGKPDVLERYRKGELIGKPKSLNLPIVTQKGEDKNGKKKNLFHRLIMKIKHMK